MNNIKIKEEKNVLFIKKGIIRARYCVYYSIFIFVLVLIGSIFFQNNLIVSEKSIYIIGIFIGIPFYSWVIVFLIFCFAGIKGFNLFLETIEVNVKSQKIILKSVMLNVTLSFHEIDSIESSFKRNGFLKSFKDLCTLTFITNDAKKYRWGFQLTEEKGKELIELIKDRIKK